MKVVTAVLAVTAVAAVAWLWAEAHALHAPAAAPSPPVAVTPPASAPTPPPPPPAPEPAAPSPPAKHTRTLALSGKPALPPAEPAQPPAPSEPVAPAESVAARARVESLLGAVARVCPLPRDADRTQHLVFRVTTSRDRVQSLEHGQGALPDAVVACIDKRLTAARWPAAPAPLTLELDVRAADLQ